jgi:plasmid stabilization system protein ParE
MIDRIEKRCLSLGDNPARGTPLHGLGRSGIRRVIEGHYVIVYEASEDTVYILHVLHGACDIDRILTDDAPRRDEA